MADIDPVGPAEHLGQTLTAGPGAADLVMIVDHGDDVRCPCLPAGFLQIVLGQPPRWRQIVERPCRPDTEIVEGAGDDDLLQLLRIQCRQPGTEVDDPVHMVPVAVEIVAERVAMSMEKPIQEGEGGVQHGYPQAGLIMGFWVRLVMSLR